MCFLVVGFFLIGGNLFLFCMSFITYITSQSQTSFTNLSLLPSIDILYNLSVGFVIIISLAVIYF